MASKYIIDCNNLILFRLYFGSVETLKCKPTKSGPCSCYVFFEAFGASVFCVSLPGVHVSLVICVWGYTCHCDTSNRVCALSRNKKIKSKTMQWIKSRNSDIIDDN